jgi:hypothetical protein
MQHTINKYEVQIKSTILALALLLFIYSFKNQNAQSNKFRQHYGYTNAK